MFLRGLQEFLQRVPYEQRWSVISLREKIAVSGKEGDQGRLDERFVHWLWQEQRFDSESLETIDGQRVQVISPGWRSRQEGPDFKQAVILIGTGEKRKGDIEVHVHSSDWAGHKHSEDPRYNEVILHVVFRANRGDGGVRTAKDRPLSEVELSRFLEEDLDLLRQDFLAVDFPPHNPFPPGSCCSVLETKTDERIAVLLEWAGDERVCSRADPWEKTLESEGCDEVLYRGWMEALGYKANQAPFRRLAAAAPWKELKGMDPLELQAVLFRIAGIWGGTKETMPHWDEATCLYIHRLERRWIEVAERFEPLISIGLKWPRSGWRPANHPARRLVGLSHFLGAQASTGAGLFLPFLKDLESLRDRRTEKKKEYLEVYRAWVDRLSSPEDRYWSTRYTLGGKSFLRPLRLIGKERASAMIINVVIPLAWTFSRRRGDTDLEETLHRLYRFAPRLEDNSSSRFMRARLFGEKARERKACFVGARCQQGLLHLYQSYCLPQGGECEGCGLLILAQAL